MSRVLPGFDGFYSLSTEDCFVGDDGLELGIRAAKIAEIDVKFVPSKGKEYSGKIVHRLEVRSETDRRRIKNVLRELLPR